MRIRLRGLREDAFGFFVLAGADKRIGKQLARRRVRMCSEVLDDRFTQVLRRQILMRLFLRTQIGSDDQCAVRVGVGERSEMPSGDVRVILIERNERRAVVADRRGIERRCGADVQIRCAHERRHRGDIRIEQRRDIAPTNEEWRLRRRLGDAFAFDPQHERVALLAKLAAQPVRRVRGVGDRAAQSRARRCVGVGRGACDGLFDATARNHGDRCVVAHPGVQMFVERARGFCK